MATCEWAWVKNLKLKSISPIKAYRKTKPSSDAIKKLIKHVMIQDLGIVLENKKADNRKLPTLINYVISVFP